MRARRGDSRVYFGATAGGFAGSGTGAVGSMKRFTHTAKPTAMAMAMAPRMIAMAKCFGGPSFAAGAFEGSLVFVISHLIAAPDGAAV